MKLFGYLDDLIVWVIHLEPWKMLAATAISFVVMLILCYIMMEIGRCVE